MEIEFLKFYIAWYILCFWFELANHVLRIRPATVLYLIASGHQGFDLQNGFASNGYGFHSPGHYSLLACFICEVTMSFLFLIVIAGVTNPQLPSHFAPLAIGLALILIHLISIPVTNTLLILLEAQVQRYL